MEALWWVLLTAINGWAFLYALSLKRKITAACAFATGMLTICLFVKAFFHG